MAFKERLKQGKPLIGTLISLGASAVTEAISRCGFDWLWIDMEHGPLSVEQVQMILQAKRGECAALVRIPINDETWIKRVLDVGADGIIVPQVKTAEEAAKAVAACKYPPVGTRSVGMSRASGYGMDFAVYIRDANEKLCVFLQIEHVDGVKNIDSILKVPGIDAIIIGPYDMSGSFGKLGQIHDPEVQQAIDTVRKACKSKSIPIGIFCLQPDLAKKYIEQGYELINLGCDIHFLWSSAKASLESIKPSK
ncbi:MAG TPA: aldolase/citrate lyase family protein [Drouetiella sp.]|jgi:2-keto-3-deoxy-L-rhamnonate aldolase RhmA